MLKIPLIALLDCYSTHSMFCVNSFEYMHLKIVLHVQLKYRLKKLCNQSKSVFNAISIYVVLVNKSHFETCNFFLMFNIDTLKSLCS